MRSFRVFMRGEKVRHEMGCVVPSVMPASACDEDGAEPEDKALDFPVGLFSQPHLWSLALGRDRANKISDTVC